MFMAVRIWISDHLIKVGGVEIIVSILQHLPNRNEFNLQVPGYTMIFGLTTLHRIFGLGFREQMLQKISFEQPTVSTAHRVYRHQ